MALGQVPRSVVPERNCQFISQMTSAKFKKPCQPFAVVNMCPNRLPLVFLVWFLFQRCKGPVVSKPCLIYGLQTGRSKGLASEPERFFMRLDPGPVKSRSLGGGFNFLFLPRTFGEMIQFDLRIFFKWVGAKPPTSRGNRAFFYNPTLQFSSGSKSHRFLLPCNFLLSVGRFSQSLWSYDNPYKWPNWNGSK